MVQCLSTVTALPFYRYLITVSIPRDKAARGWSRPLKLITCRYWNGWSFSHASIHPNAYSQVKLDLSPYTFKQTILCKVIIGQRSLKFVVRKW